MRTLPSLEKLDSVIDETIAEHDGGELVPDVLFHYVRDEVALRSIISDKAIWSTYHGHQADRRELISLDEWAKEVAAKVLATAKPAHVQDALRSFRTAYDKQRIASRFRFYLSCFSASSSSAHNWRNFADEGRGFCLGLRYRRESSRDLNDRRARIGTMLLRVRYDVADQQARLEGMFQGLANAHRTFLSSRPPASAIRQSIRLLRSAYFRATGALAIVGKMPQYREEDEWRLVVVREKGCELPLRTRRTDRGDVEYMSTSLLGSSMERLDLAEVIVGSAVSAEFATASVRAALAAGGHPPDEVPIRVSEVPVPTMGKDKFIGDGSGVVFLEPGDPTPENPIDRIERELAAKAEGRPSER